LRDVAPARGLRNQRWWLLAIMVVALALRLWDLTLADVWFDEAVSASQARLGFIDMLVATGRDNYPPLHNIVLYPIVHLFGDGALALRLPSVLFGLATILIAADLGRLLFGARAGLVTAALVAASPLHIYYCQDGRMYTLFACVAALSMWALVRWRAAPSRGRAAVYVVATVLCLYAHFYSVFIVLAQNLWLLRLWRRGALARLKPWLGMQAVTSLAFLPWAVIMLHRTLVLQKHGFWLPQPDLYHTLEVPLALVIRRAAGRRADRGRPLAATLARQHFARVVARNIDCAAVAPVVRDPADLLATLHNRSIDRRLFTGRSGARAGPAGPSYLGGGRRAGRARADPSSPISRRGGTASGLGCARL